jgi:hypothetical protein
MGVSFAIPVDVALDVIGMAPAPKFRAVGWGVIREVNRDLAESFIDKPSGARRPRNRGGPREAGLREEATSALNSQPTSTCRRFATLRRSRASRQRSTTSDHARRRRGALNIVVGELAESEQWPGRDRGSVIPVPSRIGVVVER